MRRERLGEGAGGEEERENVETERKKKEPTYH
jgi:hypothetical protein